MNKYLITKILYIIIISVSLILTIFIVRKNLNKQKELNAKLPIFTTITLKGNIIDNARHIQNTPSVFIAFSPDCDHCQYEAKSINERQEDLKNTNIVLFTSANDSLTKAFAHTYGLDTIKNVQVISDKNDEMRQLFDVKTIPSIFIYNKEGQLIKQYKGETKIDAILKAIAPQ